MPLRQTKRTKRTIVMFSKSAHRCQIPTDEAITAMKDLSSNAYKLLIYYYSRNSGWMFEDEEIADSIGFSVKTLKILKKELVEKNYLLIEKGGAIDNYFVGRKVVNEWKNPDIELEENSQKMKDMLK